MSALNREKILSVHHWNDSLFSFTTTRSGSLRFRSGQFVMIGLEVEGRPLLRAYSFVNAHYADDLEFYSIKVTDGPLTSRLRHVKAGDDLWVGRKPTGTLVLPTLRPGRNLYLLSTGTGLAPFLSIVRDPDAYERFEKVVLVHGVRRVSDLAYRDYILEELPRHELVGDEVRTKLLYYPTVTREAYENRGRITHLLETGKLTSDLALPPLDPERDRVMICGGPDMLRDLSAMLDARGFTLGASHSPGDYTYERAFVER